MGRGGRAATAALREDVTQPGSLMFKIGGYDLKSVDTKLLREKYEKAVKDGRLVRTEFRNRIESLLRTAGNNIHHISNADSTTSAAHTATNIESRTTLIETLRFLRGNRGIWGQVLTYNLTTLTRSRATTAPDHEADAATQVRHDTTTTSSYKSRPDPHGFLMASAHHHSSGEGHIYQGRFKSFPIQDDDHFHVACRYVERNALRARLVERTEQWRWGSLRRWLQRPEPEPQLLSPWPIARGRNWISLVNEPLTRGEFESVRRCIRRSRPLGEESWVQTTAQRLGIESTLRPRGRPRVRPGPEQGNKES